MNKNQGGFMPQGTYYNPNFMGSAPAPGLSYFPEKKKYKPLSKKDYIFMALFFAGMFVFANFAVHHFFSLGFTIFYYILFALSTAYLYKRDVKTDVFSILCGVISLADAATLSLYSNNFINTISVFLIFGLFTLYCLGISGNCNYKKGSYKILFDIFSSVFVYPFKNLGEVSGSVKAGARQGRKAGGAVGGIALSIPVLCVIIPLLVKSDAAFEGLINSVAQKIGEYLGELLLALVLTPVVFSAMLGKKRRLNHTEMKSQKRAKRIFSASGSTAFLTIISVTYLVYLFSQLAYFFSAFKNILPSGYTRTASSFARRGFYEAFAVCAINAAVISLVTMLTKRKNKKLSPSMKALSLFISLFSLLLIVTAIQKMRLNITTYGFTGNRLLVFVFMLMMLVVFAFLIVHIFAPGVNYMQGIIIICSLMFVAVSFADIDSFTFEHNYTAYKNGSIGAQTFLENANGLSPNTAFLTKVAKTDDKEIAHKAAVLMIESELGNEKDGFSIKNGRLEFKNSDFRSYNRSRENAKKLMTDYYYSLSGNEKLLFDSVFKQLKDDGYYDLEGDTISDGIFAYSYNPEQGMYNIKQE